MSAPWIDPSTCRTTCVCVADTGRGSSGTGEGLRLFDEPPHEFPSRSPIASPAATRLPAIPVFEGLDSDLPDISGLSLWFDDDDSSSSSSLGPGQAALDYGHPHDDSNCSSDAFHESSIASHATDGTDMSSDMSFGPFTPSSSNPRIGLRDCGSSSRARRWLPRGIGLGILGLDLDPSFQSTIGDAGLATGIRKRKPMLDNAIVVNDSGGSGLHSGISSPASSPPFSLDDLQFPSGHTLTSIPECDSWIELGEALRSSRDGRQIFDSANTSFSYSDFNDYSGREGEDTGYDLDLSFSFPAQTTSDDSGESSPQTRRNRSKTFLSPTISSDLKRTSSSSGSKLSSSPRSGIPPASPSPTLPPVPFGEFLSMSSPFGLSAAFGPRSASLLSSPAGGVEPRVYEKESVSVKGGSDQQAVGGGPPQSMVGHTVSSHKRWRM